MVNFWPQTDYEHVDRNLLDVKEFCDTILAPATKNLRGFQLDALINKTFRKLMGFTNIRSFLGLCPVFSSQFSILSSMQVTI